MSPTDEKKIEWLRKLREERDAAIAAGLVTDWDRNVREVIEQAERNNATVRLDLIDELVKTGNANIDEMAAKYGGGSVRDGQLAQVTSIIHGKERPTYDTYTGGPDWWLTSHLDTRTYEIHPEFSAAWRRASGLS